jgi:hypothetical protein
MLWSPRPDMGCCAPAAGKELKAIVITYLVHALEPIRVTAPFANCSDRERPPVVGPGTA